jgi:ATP-dependent 26S proteasome regulatory subunit
VRAQGRKIIFTTNLPNFGDLDEALVRPGRCFGVVRGRSLNGDEIERLVVRLCAGNVDWSRRAMDRLVTAGSRTASVATVYRACSEAAGAGWQL